MLGFLSNLFMTYYVGGTILMIAHRLLMALALNLDCRARNIGARRLYTILGFVFPIIVGIIYAIKRKGLRSEYKICHACGTKTRADLRRCSKCGSVNLYEYENPKKKLFTIISIILCVASVVCFCVYEASEFEAQQEALKAIADGEYEDDAEDEIISDDEFYYDAKGIAHTSIDNMKYYTADGEEYTYNQICEMSNAFIGEDNFLYFIEREELTPVENSDFSYEYYDGEDTAYTATVEYKDKDGKSFYLATAVKWDYSCRLLPLG